MQTYPAKTTTWVKISTFWITNSSVPCIFFPSPKKTGPPKKTGEEFLHASHPFHEPSKMPVGCQAAANVPKLLGLDHSVYYSISSISPRIPSRPRPWRSGKKTEIMLLKKKTDIYVPGSSIFVCKMCAEIHPQKPTTRQNIYISGRYRYRYRIIHVLRTSRTSLYFPT